MDRKELPIRGSEIFDVEYMHIAIYEEIQRSEESRYDYRLHDLLLVYSGLSCYGTASLLCHSSRTVENAASSL